FVTQCVVADKLSSAVFAILILLPGGFSAIFLYFYTLAIGAMERNLYLHNYKVTTLVTGCQIFMTAYFL
ncbi:hypothetical protein EZS27_031058, partial [termite gut metagenome]